MTKRKLSAGEAAPAKEVEAAEDAEQQEEQEEQEGEDLYAPGPIDTDPLQFLIAPQETSSFLEKIWECAPLYVPATDERKKFFEGLLDFEGLARLSDALEAGTLILYDQDPGAKGDALTLEDDVDDAMCREVGPLMFGRDVIAARYIDGKRETIEGDFADSETLRSLHDSSGATLQLIQPQRFINGVWRLVAAMEAASGCLVGCNAYITPAGTQGLAPHHDDVELFVCQTAGTKTWKMYKPLEGYQLPSRSSEDLAQDAVGDPILEVTLTPGDVLYIPRGIVHQAVAQDSGSCHLTVSTYQNWTWGNLAEGVLKQALASSGDPKYSVPLELRKGLPMGLVWKAGLQAELADTEASAATARSSASALAAGLRALATSLEEAPSDMLAGAVDVLAEDFLVNRMPPHPCQLPEEGPAPELGDSLVVRGRNLFRLVPKGPEAGVSDDEEEDEGEEEEEDEEEEKEKAYVMLVTCVNNSRFSHMIARGDGDSDYDSEDDEEHEHDHEHGDCGDPHCTLGGDEDSDGAVDEGEGEDKVEEEKEASVKKGRRKVGKAAADEEAEAASEKEAKEAKEGEEPVLMATSGDGEEGGGDSSEGGSDDDDDDESEEEEEKKLEGPVFPAVYAAALAEVLASTPERPLPILKLQVPSGIPDEQLRLARMLHEFGFVVTVPAPKKAKEAEPEGAKDKKAGKAEAPKGKGKENPVAKSEEKEKAKSAEKGKKGEEAAKEKEKGKKGEEKGKSAEKGKKAEEKGKSAEKGKKAEEEAAAAPPAKKAKKGGK